MCKSNKNILLWILLAGCAVQQIAPLNCFSEFSYPKYNYTYENFASFLQSFPFLNFTMFQIVLSGLLIISLPLVLLIIAQKLALTDQALSFIMIGVLHPAFTAMLLNPNFSILGFLALMLTLYYLPKFQLSGFLLLLAVLFEPLIIMALPLFLINKQFKMLMVFLAGILIVGLGTVAIQTDFWGYAFFELKKHFLIGQFGFNYPFALLGVFFSPNGYADGFILGLIFYLVLYLIFLISMLTKTPDEDQQIISILLSIPFIISMPGLAEYETYHIISIMLPVFFWAKRKGLTCHYCEYGLGLFYLLSALDVFKFSNLVANIIITIIPQIGLGLFCLFSCVLTIRWGKSQN